MIRNQKLRIRVTAALLLLVLAFSLAGCAGIDTDAMEQRVRAMLDCDVTGDVEGSFALLYPGVTDEENYRKTFQQIQEYFPITEGYTLSLEKYNVTKQVGTQSRTVESLCATMTAVSFRALMFSMITCSVFASRAEVASSRISTFGFRAKARAIVMRWHCPPEKFLPPERTT